VGRGREMHGRHRRKIGASMQCVEEVQLETAFICEARRGGQGHMWPKGWENHGTKTSGAREDMMRVEHAPYRCPQHD
jgi:hypothetical protein